MDFAQRLRELRLNKGLSQKELGERLGLHNSTISMYERGEREPDFDTLDLIADYFNVDVQYLLGREIGSMYYLDPTAAQMAKEVFDREDMRILFDAVKDVSAEDLQFVIKMVKGLSNDK